MPLAPPSRASFAANCALLVIAEKSSNQSTSPGVTLNRRKQSLNRLKCVAFRSSSAGFNSASVNLRRPQHSLVNLASVPLAFFAKTENTQPSNGVCSISPIWSRRKRVFGSSQPNSMSFFSPRAGKGNE